MARLTGIMRARPRMHERTDYVRGASYVSPTTVNRGLTVPERKQFLSGLTVRQVGAIPLKHRNKTYYELGGGLFTQGQILESRRRLAEIKYGQKVSRAQVGE